VGGRDKGPSRRAVRGLMGHMTHAASEQVGTWKGAVKQGNRTDTHLSVTSKVPSGLSDISLEFKAYSER
jgi:hypothetical protein